MQIRTESFQPYDHLDSNLAFCRFDRATHVTFSANRNPHVAWLDVPVTTRSFALLFWDSEVPTRPDDVNQEGREVPLELPRADFFHWVAADLPANLREIPEGSHSAGVVARGKAPGPTPHGGLQGKNDYTGWFAGHAEMEGTYAGYDGPCPPWNDSRMHAYHLAVYALDVASLRESIARFLHKHHDEQS